MLMRPESESQWPTAPAGRMLDAFKPNGMDLGMILAAVRRQRWVVIVSAIVFLILGIAFSMQQFSRYTASLSLLIDAKKVGVSAQSALEGSLTFESGAVESQVLVLMSEKIAGVVTDRLQLASSTEFLEGENSYLGILRNMVTRRFGTTLAKLTGDPPPPRIEDYPPEVKRFIAITKLLSNLKVTRVGRTYVLQIDYTALDPRLAAAIATAFGEAYLDDQLESKYDTMRRASVWMDDRIQELRVKAVNSDRAVQEYRTKNNLVVASGRLMSEQALTEARTQLTVAQGELASTQARFERLRQIIDGKQYAAAVTESLGSPLINDLRSKYLQASKSESEISAKLGSTHAAAEAARRDMAQYERLIFTELQRIQQSTQSEVQVAKEKVETLERSMVTMKATNAIDGEAQVKLRSLEQEADTYKQLYTAFLQKYQLTTQQESFPITDARVITPAAVPLGPSAPRVIIIVAASVLGGILLGSLIGAFREFRERGFRTSQQVRHELGIEHLANLPMLTRKELKRKRRDRKPRGAAREPNVARVSDPIMRYAVDNPLSRYAEGLRAIRIASDLAFGDRKCSVLGFISMYPNEGKSTAAKNYASLLASQGQKVLLIDCDLRNPELTRRLAPTAIEGLVDIIRNNRRAEHMFVEEDGTGLKILPGATHKRMPPGGDLLATPRMRQLIQELSGEFEHIIVDLPPMGAVTDGAAMAPLIDGFVLVIEWGETPRAVLREMLIEEPGVADKVLGGVLSKVVMNRLHFYDAYANYGSQKGYNDRYYAAG